MPRRIAAPRRLRRRLTVAFVLVAAVSAGGLAGGSYLAVRQARLNDSGKHAADQTALTIDRLEQGGLPKRPSPEAVGALLGSFATTAETVAVVGGQPVPSVSFSPAQVPPDLAKLVGAGLLAYQRTSLGGQPFVVAGGRLPGFDVEVFSFFSEQQLDRDLSVLGLTLLGGWGVVVLLAGAVGLVLARRTLAPVARASEAARSMAEGLLETRLPVRRQDEFGAWAESFNEMARALEAKIADLSEAGERERRFTSDVAHELRTPLTALVSEASLLREHLDQMPEEARRPAELLVSDVARLRRLVEDLMEISRFDAARQEVRAEPVDVSSVVAGTLRARGWESRVEVRAQPLVLQTDRRRLERIVGNLVGNALEHGGRDVSVTVARGGTEAIVEVADRGRGIAPEHLAHLFDRFYKADPSRSSPGSGLGLGIAMENARLLGGDIRVWSEVGTGSTFTLSLPVTEPLPANGPEVAGLSHDEVHIDSEGGPR